MEIMLTPKRYIQKFIIWFLFFALLISACSQQTTTEAEVSPSPAQPTHTASPEAPTPTLIPAAAIVNGERIPLAWFQSELDRYLKAQEQLEQPLDETEAKDVVLNDLIDQVLLAQAAREAGAEITDEAVQDRLDSLAEGTDLTTWMAEWGYSEADLAQSLKLQLLALDQRNRIIEGVPDAAEQVELRQVFAYTEGGAKDALLSLNSGRDFEEVAFLYDPITGGYLGWVPRGYLLIPALNEAAFSLEVGAYSEIIESDIGYHILMVLDREERPLSTDARLMLQRQALYDWLEEQRALSAIEVLID